MLGEEKTIHSRKIYEGKIINLRIDQVLLPDGKEHSREIVEHQGSVGILPLLSPDRILLIRQFRKPVEDFIWEIPAGRIEKGENLQDCARRELEEETGYICGSLQNLGVYYPSPGYCTERIHLFVAEQLEKGIKKPEADEFIEVKIFTLKELKTYLEEGKIRDGKTLASLFLYQIKVKPSFLTIR